jgi:hypothetical protein
VNPITTVGTLLPNPNGDNDLDWALYTSAMAHFSGATVDTQQPFEYDLKAKRKVQEMGQTWTLNLWAPAVSAGSPQVFARTLVALP